MTHAQSTHYSRSLLSGCRREKVMRRVRCIVGVTVLLSVAGAGAAGQSAPEGLLEPARQALGGQGLASVRTLRVEGESTRVVA